MKDMRLVNIEIYDIRFPASAKRVRLGVKATDFDPDYSGTYVIIETSEENYQGYGIAFVREDIELMEKVVKAMFNDILMNETTTRLYAELGAIWKRLSTKTLHWLSVKKFDYLRPAAIAIINALWDLWARIEEKPVWKLLADMKPADFLTTIDFTDVMDVLTPEEALEMLLKRYALRDPKEFMLKADGCFASATGIGYYDQLKNEDHICQRIRDLCRNFKKLDFKTFEVHADPTLEGSVTRCLATSNIMKKLRSLGRNKLTMHEYLMHLFCENPENFEKVYTRITPDRTKIFHREETMESTAHLVRDLCTLWRKPRIVLNVNEFTWEAEDLSSFLHRLLNIRNMTSDMENSPKRIVKSVPMRSIIIPHCIKLTSTAIHDIKQHLTIQTEMDKNNVKTSSGEKCDSYLEFKEFATSRDRLPHIWDINVAKVGLSEALIICMMARKTGSPVWLHGDGLGLGEMGQHVQLWNIMCVNDTDYNVEDYLIEFVNYQHGYFENPVLIQNGCYMPPTRPGFSTQLKDKCISRWSYPEGARWKHLIKTIELEKSKKELEKDDTDVWYDTDNMGVWENPVNESDE